MKRLPVACVLLAMPALVQAQVDEAANARIKAEGMERSAVMKTLEVLTDRYGPRLTGSPNHEAAAKWAAKQLSDWGLKNAHLETWDFGHAGWTNEKAEGYLITSGGARVAIPFGVSAWTPSTQGTVTAQVVQMVVPGGTKDELAAWLEGNKEKIKGKIVMVGKAAVIAEAPAGGGARRGGGAGGAGPGRGAATAPATARGAASAPAARGARGGGGGATPARANPQADEMINAWLLANGALMRVDGGGAANGMLHEVHNRNFEVSKAVPGVIVRNEDFGRMERLLAAGDEVKMEFNIVNKSHPEGARSPNVIAEIPGTAEGNGEIVMLGAHLDCWHLATGATDNGAAVSMMMEAVRIIQASGLKPKRTIRIGLWSGEEQGLFGSQAYVAEHFGTFENPKPDFEKVLCYFNVDSGAGSVSSVMVFGPPEAQGVLKEAIAPFADLGAGGASGFLSRALGSTDSSSFSHAGISTVDGMQSGGGDYGLTHHTSFDTYDRVVPENLMKGSVVLAGAVWEVANRKEKLPLFNKESMPKAVGGR